MYKLTPGNGVLKQDSEGIYSIFIVDNNQNSEWIKYKDWLKTGHTPDPADPEPIYVPVILRSTIIARLEALPSPTGTAGRNAFDDAYDALTADGKAMFRWNSMVEIKVDDAQVIALLTGIGVDVTKVMY